MLELHIPSFSLKGVHPDVKKCARARAMLTEVSFRNFDGMPSGPDEMLCVNLDLVRVEVTFSNIDW